MNVKEYRRQVEAELNAKAASNARVSDFSAKVVVGADTPDIRAAVSGENWDEAIKQLADPKLDEEARLVALQFLQAGTFLGARFAPYRAKYLAALRTAATSADDAELRHSALDILANLKDDFARQKLMDGLQGAGTALVSPAVALGLLARDDHGSISTLARDLLKSSTDVHTREQAARVLGSDPSAKNLLSELMTDKTEFSAVRRASAVALRNLDPGEFETNARSILADHGDFGEIKATVKGATDRLTRP
ncbi:hypothetical protein HB777_17035 [Mesorhizobium loti]|nr:hypothetical protein HB777_17035 [Mesorhizobium loti]